LGTEGWRVKRLAIGLTCCLAGVLLYAVNWLGAAINVAQVTEWDTRYGRLHSAFALVGHRPLTFGIVLFAAGVALVLWSVVASVASSFGADSE
jgi:hypothetical protein